MESQVALALADNVRRLKEARGLSQKEIEKLSGARGQPKVSASAIGYVLNYRDTNDRHAALDTVEGLARVFGVEPHELLIPGFAKTQNVVPLPIKRTAKGAAPSPSSVSQAVRLDALTMALELTDEVLTGKALPAAKRAELVSLVYEGLVDGLPQAKILRMARSAAK